VEVLQSVDDTALEYIRPTLLSLKGKKGENLSLPTAG
jgi:hypothetical protein